MISSVLALNNFSLFLIMFNHLWIPLIWKPDNYQSLQSDSKVPSFTNNREPLPWSHSEHPAPLQQSQVCTRHLLVNSLTFTQDTTFIMMMTVFFPLQGWQVAPGISFLLRYQIKSPPNFWLLNSAARVLGPAPESCSPKPSRGEVVFISGTQLRFLETKHSGINK